MHDMQDCKDRPLIFIGHCFGGLVIQKVRSFQYTIHVFSGKRQTLTLHTSGLVNSTVGIIFLGTPHSGTVSFSSKGVSTKDFLTVIAMHSELRHEPKVLSELESAEYSALLEVSEDFLDLCRSSRGVSLQVINFFEQRASKVGKQIGRNDLQVLSYKMPLCHTKC